MLEDDSFTRLTLVTTLRTAGLIVVAECSTASEALESHALHRPAVAVLDLDLGPGPTGLDVAHALRRSDPRIGIVFLTSFHDARLVTGNGQQAPGGSQYLVKQNIESLSTILSAIRSSMGSRTLSHPGASGLEEFGSLTATQIETLRLVAEGLSNKEIAHRRNVREKSVEQTIGRIAHALNITTSLSSNQRVNLAKAYFRLRGVPGPHER